MRHTEEEQRQARLVGDRLVETRPPETQVFGTPRVDEARRLELVDTMMDCTMHMIVDAEELPEESQPGYQSFRLRDQHGNENLDDMGAVGSLLSDFGVEW